MKYANQLQLEVKKLKQDKRELKKEIKALESILSLVMYAENSVPSEFYFPLLEKLNSCKKYSRAVTAAWVMQTIGIIIFYMVV